MPADFHPALASYLTAHREQLATAKRALHEQLRPINAAATGVRATVLQLRAALHDAELEAHPAAQDTTLNFMHARLKNAEVCAESLWTAARAMSQAITELETGHALSIEDLARVLELNPPATAPLREVVESLALAPDPDVTKSTVAQ